MTPNCAFTIVAKNYIGLAKLLEESFKKYNPDDDFLIVVADELNDDIIDETNIIEARSVLNISPELWNELAFKYDLTEFCTSIKPKTFEYLFNEKGYTKILYLDPDIFCFSSLDGIYDLLDTYKIVVTPHFLSLPNQDYKGDLPENIFLGMGIFNLGFLGLRKSKETSDLLDWWHRVLSKQCFMDKEQYTATDQKWMNYLPMFFSPDILHIIRDKGVNAAPWNFFERKFSCNKDGRIEVSSRINKDSDSEELVFVHFSNYKYSELAEGVLKHYSLKYDYEDISIIFQQYLDAIQNGRINEFISLPYSYNTFSDGTPISIFNRRLYRRLLEDNAITGNPFESEGEFFRTLKKKNLLTKYSAVTTRVRKISEASDKENKANRVFNVIYRTLHKTIGIDRLNKLCKYIARKSQLENLAFLYDKNLPGLMK